MLHQFELGARWGNVALVCSTEFGNVYRWGYVDSAGELLY